MSCSTESSAYRVRQAHWAQDREALSRVRRMVFIEEQGVPEPMEWDGGDEIATHLLALDPEGRPIGTARILDSGQIGRMAVLAAWRRRGVGSALLAEALELARRLGQPSPFLHAQTSALGFYCRYGFHTRGPEFQEAGIPHRLMIFGERP